MPYNPETEEFYQNPSTVVDSTPDGDSVKEGFDDRLSPAMTQVYEDINLLKATGMIGVGIPATTTGRGISRIADDSEAGSGVTGDNGPAFITPEQLKVVVGNAQALAQPLGDIRLLPFRNTELPTGWYFCNGGRFNNDTAVAIALNALPANFKTDWGITDNGTTTNVPNMFHEDGRGYFVRGVNGTARQVGSVEQDALQNIAGTLGIVIGPPDGKLFQGTSPGYQASAGSGLGLSSTTMDASRTARTATETRSINIGMTWAIFLGV